MCTIYISVDVDRYIDIREAVADAPNEPHIYSIYILSEE